MNAIIVSVVIPCYNAAHCLARAVRSVARQGVDGTEIVIVDDQSTDDSRAVAQSLAGEFPNVRLFVQSVNAGPAAARNEGLRHAAGRYVCFLDSDDEYAPGFFSHVLPTLEQNKELAWISTGIELVNCHRAVHPVQLQAIVGSLPSNLIVRKTAADLVGGFPESAIFRGRGAGEDIMFRVLLKRWFRGMHRPDKFLRYWISKGSHFDYFLDRSTVERGELIFTSKSPDEQSGELVTARRFHEQQANERLSIFGAMRNPEEVYTRLADRFLETVETYDQLRTTFDDVRGSLTPREGFALHHYAKEGQGRGAIVEIGSQFGRATCWLASGARAASREKVVAVDAFRNSSVTTLPMFLANLQKQGLREWVDVRAGSFQEIGGKWQGPIRLLFINGSDEVPFASVETWSNHMMPGGLMVFHGVDISQGVTQRYRELLQASASWKEIGRIQSLRIVRLT